jgi:hypothetical protein
MFLRNALEKLKLFLNRRTKVWQTFPPYVLLAAIWWSSSQAQERIEEQRQVDSQVEIAAQKFESDIREYNRLVDDREACFKEVASVDNTRSIFIAIFDYLGTLGAAGAQIEADLSAILDENLKDRSPEECELSNPKPPIPIPDPILIESGFIQDSIIPTTTVG